MWNPFSKETKLNKTMVEKVKYTKLVEHRIEKFLLSTYIAKIYNESGKEIGKTCFSDEILYNGFTDTVTYLPGSLYTNEGFFFERTQLGYEKPNKCSYALVSNKEYERFKCFKNDLFLTFKDYDENTVILSTDIIKKIVIEVADTWEEEVQIYKEIFEETEEKRQS